MANKVVKLLATLLALITITPFASAQTWGNQFVVPFPKPIPQPADTISMVFIGDVMMHQKQLGYDCRTFLEPIRNRLEKADVAIANMEFTLAGEPYSGYPAFSAPDAYAEYITDCGVDVFLTANNHITDKGTRGLQRTIEAYDSMESDNRILYTGISKDEQDYPRRNPLMISVMGTKIALINFTYGTNTTLSAQWPKINYTNREEIHQAIERAKEKQAEFIIALPHWGAEYVLNHGKTQENLAKFLSEEGVDLIVGAHPHVVQDTCKIGSTHVIYSMGNAVSNMSAKYTRLELMVTVKIVTAKNGEPAKMLTPELEFMWCTLPGTLTDSYATIPLKEYLGKKELWKSDYDYDNMVSTYKQVKDATGIED
ncbi:MAG: CapA family protein [Bacteroidales bacterium]|nr:CapA family protein [Bacteroidales bacterium]